MSVPVGSALAYRGIPLQAAYCGTKHALEGFTESLRTELRRGGGGIRVTMVRLPAMNTPQFEWARTHMGERPKPMDCIYAPEAAADAVWRAANGRAASSGARTTLAVILGNALAPGLLDQRLARTAYRGQSTGEPVQPDRRDNLEAPVHGLHRTHGSFVDMAHRRALTLSGALTRLSAAAVGVVACLGAGVLLATAAKATRPSPRASTAGPLPQT